MISRRTILTASSAALTFPIPVSAASLDTILNVKPFEQTKQWSCWAAAAVILLHWKNNLPLKEADVAQRAGSDFVKAFASDTGLTGSQFIAFAKALGLTTEAPKNLTASGYHAMLKAHGPLRVGSRLDFGTSKTRRHIRVLRGVTGDGTSAGSNAWVLDPDGGRDYKVSIAQFSLELEQIAREELGTGNDLFPQIIRFP